MAVVIDLSVCTCSLHYGKSTDASIGALENFCAACLMTCNSDIDFHNLVTHQIEVSRLLQPRTGD
jgi:hypothetical protein